MTHPAVFFDRDGTLMEEVGFCGDPQHVHVFRNVPQALARLRSAGFKIVVVTNQSGIGRGIFSEADYHAVHAEFLRQIGDGLIDATYYCPDAHDPNSACRKPKPAMLLLAARQHGLDLARSYMAGDRNSDIEAGRAAGAKSILVRTGYGVNADCTPDFDAPDVLSAIDWILRDSGSYSSSSS